MTVLIDGHLLPAARASLWLFRGAPARQSSVVRNVPAQPGHVTVTGTVRSGGRDDVSPLYPHGVAPPAGKAHGGGRSQVRAGLLDLVLGRSGPSYATWLHAKPEQFRVQIQHASLDPVRGYANAYAAACPTPACSTPQVPSGPGCLHRCLRR